MHRNIYGFVENKVHTRRSQDNSIWNSKIQYNCILKRPGANKPIHYRHKARGNALLLAAVVASQVCISFSVRLMTITDFDTTSAYLLCAWEKCSRRVKRRSTEDDAGGVVGGGGGGSARYGLRSSSSSNGNGLGSRAGPPCSAGTATT